MQRLRAASDADEVDHPISPVFRNVEASEHQSKLEFSAAAYAVLESDQAVNVQIKRTGPIDTDIRFRCLGKKRNHAFSFSVVTACTLSLDLS